MTIVSLSDTDVVEIRPKGSPTIMSFHAQTIKRTNVYQLTADRLVQTIAEEGLKSGDFLPTERELSERFGVGRSSVRESLRLLEAHRIIEPQPGGSYRVGERHSLLLPALEMMVALGGVTLGDLHQFRTMLEIETVRVAARGAEADGIAKIRSALQAMIANRKSPERALQEDLAFHVAIADATNNSAFIAAIHGVRGALAESVSAADIDIDEAISHHQLILEAIIAKDEDHAVECMREHMNFVRAERHLE